MLHEIDLLGRYYSNPLLIFAGLKAKNPYTICLIFKFINQGNKLFNKTYLVLLPENYNFLVTQKPKVKFKFLRTF